MTTPIMDWNGLEIAQFSQATLEIEHRLHESDLFCEAALARLIDKSARENYYVNTMDLDAHNVSTRCEGETGDIIAGSRWSSSWRR